MRLIEFITETKERTKDFITLRVPIGKWGAIVPCYLDDGTEIRLLLDSGASATMVKAEKIKKGNLKFIKQTVIFGSFQEYNLSQLYKGGITFKQGNQSITIPDIDIYEEADGYYEDIDGLFGRDVLRNCIVTYDGPKKEVVIKVKPPRQEKKQD